MSEAIYEMRLMYKTPSNHMTKDRYICYVMN